MSWSSGTRHTFNCCWVTLLLLQIEELYKRLDDAVTVISTQNCDLKTQVADVQVRVGASTRKVEKGLELLKIASAAALDFGAAWAAAQNPHSLAMV